MKKKATERTDSLGTVWVDETPCPIVRIYFADGLLFVAADMTAIWKTLSPGRTIYRVTDPEGKTVMVAENEMPSFRPPIGGGSVTLDLPVHIYSSKPGEEWMQMEKTR